MSYLVIVADAGAPVPVQHNTPSDWTARDVYDKPRNRGFRAAYPDEEGMVEVVIVELQRPKLTQPGDKIRYGWRTGRSGDIRPRRPQRVLPSRRDQR